MEWAVAQHADVVSMSLGARTRRRHRPAQPGGRRAQSAASGTLFVIAAGNIGDRPTAIVSPPVRGRRADRRRGRRDRHAAADFSSRGPRLATTRLKPDITAPGVDIVAARAAGTSLGDAGRPVLHDAERHLDGHAARRRRGGDPQAGAPGLGRRAAQGRPSSRAPDTVADAGAVRHRHRPDRRRAGDARDGAGDALDQPWMVPLAAHRRPTGVKAGDLHQHRRCPGHPEAGPHPGARRQPLGHQAQGSRRRSGVGRSHVRPSGRGDRRGLRPPDCAAGRRRPGRSHSLRGRPRERALRRHGDGQATARQPERDAPGRDRRTAQTAASSNGRWPATVRRRSPSGCLPAPTASAPSASATPLTATARALSASTRRWTSCQHGCDPERGSREAVHLRRPTAGAARRRQPDDRLEREMPGSRATPSPAAWTGSTPNRFAIRRMAAVDSRDQLAADPAGRGTRRRGRRTGSAPRRPVRRHAGMGGVGATDLGRVPGPRRGSSAAPRQHGLQGAVALLEGDCTPLDAAVTALHAAGARAIIVYPGPGSTCAGTLTAPGAGPGVRSSSGGSRGSAHSRQVPAAERPLAVLHLRPCRHLAGPGAGGVGHRRPRLRACGAWSSTTTRWAAPPPTGCTRWRC